MKRSAMMLACVVAVQILAIRFIGMAEAAPIGTSNYDFATFSSPAFSIDGTNVNGWAQVVADVDGDGRSDRLLYAMDNQSWRTRWARALGNGTFASPVDWQVPGVWVGWTFEMADVNGDGAADMVLRANDQASWRVRVALSQLNGSFAAPIPWVGAGNWSGWNSALVDVTGDGNVDLLLYVADGNGWQSWVAVGYGTGGFANPVGWIGAGNFNGWHLGYGDFNSDGRIDLSLDYNDGTSWRALVALSSGNGSFETPTFWESVGNFVGWQRSRGDFNSDGRSDLLLWASDAVSWRAQVALADGAGRFGTPVWWSTDSPIGSGWEFSIADANGDGGSDLVMQRSDAMGWQTQVAIASGQGGFFPARQWGELATNLNGWLRAIADFTGDGRADVMLYAADAFGWRSHVAIARGCDSVITPADYQAAIAALTNGPTLQRICFAPGTYSEEILIREKENVSFIAAHGGVTLETNSFGYSPDAVPGQNPGAPVQFYDSHAVELDGFTIRNLFTFRIEHNANGEEIQTVMVSRAVEILESSGIKISNSRLIGPGKQLVSLLNSSGVLIEGSRLECYYFCIDASFSTLEVRRSAFRAEHANPADDHALFWSHHSSQKFLNSSMEMLTGKSLVGGINIFSSHIIEFAGQTTVSPDAYAWVSQHPNYDGFNVIVRGAYTPLQSWYFIPWLGGGWQDSAQICYYPDVGASHCVNHFE